MKGRATSLVAAVVVALAAAAPAVAFEAEQIFRKGALALSAEGSYGWQLDLENKSGFTGLEFWDAGVRVGFFPFATMGQEGPLHGALEIGLEPFYQQYVEPQHAFWAGLAAVARYHFLALGRLAPYVEVAGSAGGTDLRVKEIRSSFAFLIFGGVGASFFVSDRSAVYAGYRWQHVSNAGTGTPNRGFESHVAVLGASIFFP
jgi:hypothetical protein